MQHTGDVEAGQKAISKNTENCTFWSKKSQRENCDKSWSCEADYYEKIYYQTKKTSSKPRIILSDADKRGKF